MSYILDALRKSDQQRQRGTAPALFGPITAATPKQPALLTYGLLAFVLLGSGIAIGWLRPWQSEPAMPAPMAVAVKPPEPDQRQPLAARPDIAPTPEPEPHARILAQTAQPTHVPVPEPAPAPTLARRRGTAGAAVKTPSAPAEVVAEVPNKAAAQQVPEPPGTAIADAGPAQDVISLTELPLSLQQELPPMTISVHAYSARPGDRLVGINNRMLREGDYVVPGLKLEQITPDGMIFGYKGYSFRRGVK
jgi:general secretion pathway protein B